MEPFKEFLGLKKVKLIAQAVKEVYPPFEEKKFLKSLEKTLPPLELKPRMEAIAQALIDHLPKSVEKLFPILIRSAKKLEGFLVWPHTHIVAKKGIDHLELSMDALYEMTQVFTGEFAIRDFLIEHPEATLKILKKWIHDPSEHVRRLVSEGTRPMLPWGKKLERFVRDPAVTWSFLETLRTDPSLYVRKSVANHLNDHSKNHPDWLLKNLKRWQKDQNPEVNWIIRHASRTLIKKGNPEALALHGIKASKFKISSFHLSPRSLKVGQALVCRFEIKNLEAAMIKVVVDQEVGFLKKNGDLSPKVFKGKEFELNRGEKKELVIKLPIRPVTTRVYYSGIHTYRLIINGKKTAIQNFKLRV